MSSKEYDNHSHVPLLTKVFVSLLTLTVITVLASYVHFGSAAINILIAMLIATVKASLVAVFFMHLKWEDKLTWAFAGLSFPFVALFVLIDLLDIAIRYGSKWFGLH